MQPFIKVVLFFGDLDLACNFYGGEMFADKLGYEVSLCGLLFPIKQEISAARSVSR